MIPLGTPRSQPCPGSFGSSACGLPAPDGSPEFRGQPSRLRWGCFDRPLSGLLLSPSRSSRRRSDKKVWLHRKPPSVRGSGHYSDAILSRFRLLEAMFFAFNNCCCTRECGESPTLQWVSQFSLQLSPSAAFPHRWFRRRSTLILTLSASVACETYVARPF